MTTHRLGLIGHYFVPARDTPSAIPCRALLYDEVKLGLSRFHSSFRRRTATFTDAVPQFAYLTTNRAQTTTVTVTLQSSRRFQHSAAHLGHSIIRIPNQSLGSYFQTSSYTGPKLSRCATWEAGPAASINKRLWSTLQYRNRLFSDYCFTQCMFRTSAPARSTTEVAA